MNQSLQSQYSTAAAGAGGASLKVKLNQLEVSKNFKYISLGNCKHHH